MSITNQTPQHDQEHQERKQEHRSVTIRRATPSDAATLAALGRRTFTETFGHMYTAHDLQDYLDSAYAIDRIKSDLEDARSAMWIVEHRNGDSDGDAVDAIGFALAGPAVVPHEQVTPDCLELHRFYLLKAHQMSGIGSQLFAQVDEWLHEQATKKKSEKKQQVWLGVWSENLGAQRFYARHGFVKVGEYSFKVGDHFDHEFIMRRS